MTSFWPVARLPRWLMSLRLRWQLVLAFLAVSTIPVLLATMVAAQLIVGLFHDNMEHWLSDATRFVVLAADEDELEIGRAANIVATALAMNARRQVMGPLEFSAALLTASGYGIVLVYDDRGLPVYSRGDMPAGGWLPKGDRSGFFLASQAGRPVLLLGATRNLFLDGVPHVIFIGERWDRGILNLPDTGAALQVRAFPVTAERFVHLSADGDAAWRVPESVIAQLAAGAVRVLEMVNEEDILATAFAPLRDADGLLVGVVACRLPRNVALLSHVQTLEVFVFLVLAAGLLSCFVALGVSKLISRPLMALIEGLRLVREGDYRARLVPKGGRELSELAQGFNQMTQQLDELRAREAVMRRRERFAALGEAAAVIAHEIRNPLGIIKTSSEVIRMQAALPADSARLLSFVLDEVGRIDHLVQDMLDYVRPVRSVQLPVDLAAELTSVLEFAAPELSRRRIMHLLITTEQDACVNGDPTQLRQAFINIILNAIDAMPTGGQLTATVSKEQGAVVVSIADSGVGVAAAMVERMFEPFVTDKSHGTGLGLARVMHVVEAHGGSIQCSSAPGRGTCFTLRLPAPAEIC